MPQYIGIRRQIVGNNRKSILLLLAFPTVILSSVWAFFYFVNYYNEIYDLRQVNYDFLMAAPWITGIVGIWFLIAYFGHSAIIQAATGSQQLERKENKRVYNLVENLCIAEGMKMPQVNIIEDPGLNAFASGLNEKTYTVTLTRGIINALNDDELEGVIAHELMHIRNRDVRLLIVTIVFLGILAVAVEILFRSILYSGRGGGRKGKGSGGALLLIALAIALVAYLLSVVFRFALSRKREYMADAGAADMTRKPHALASALRKISGNSAVRSVKSDDVKEMFIQNIPEKNAGLFSAVAGLFSTHPPIEKRIQILDQF
jgi:heat shock protein HtpX